MYQDDMPLQCYTAAMVNHRRRYLVLLGLLACLVVAVFISITLGKYPLSLAQISSAFWDRIQGNILTSSQHTIIFNVRLPRIVLGVVVGAGLAVSGMTFQALFQNPMVSPDVLGATSGAGFGAALGILFGLSSFGITIASFTFGLVSIGIVLLVASRIRRGNKLLGLILTGIVVGSLFSAMLSFLKLVADPMNELPAITFWLMGSLAGVAKYDLLFALPLIIGSSLIIMMLRWRLNALSLGDEEAQTLGLNSPRLRLILILLATLITAAAVAVSGIIGWVGLVIPHFARLLIGSDHKYSLPAAALIGSLFLVVVDNFARLLATSEIPLGILTAFIGAPFFLYLILSMGKAR